MFFWFVFLSFLSTNVWNKRSSTIRIKFGEQEVNNETREKKKENKNNN
jgi:hypothetical protein